MNGKQNGWWLGAPLVVGALGLLGMNNIPERPLPDRAGVAYDSYGGSCGEFNDHVRTIGLRDPQGNTHPSTLGWTLCKFTVAAPPELRLTQTNNGGNICLDGDLSETKFSEEHRVVVMRWDHRNFLISEPCQHDLERTESGILAHEAHHVEDCKNIHAETVRHWEKEKGHHLKVCAPDLEKAKQKFKDQIDAELQSEVKKMDKEADFRARATHERIGYETSGINCGICGGP